MGPRKDLPGFADPPRLAVATVLGRVTNSAGNSVESILLLVDMQEVMKYARACLMIGVAIVVCSSREASEFGRLGDSNMARLSLMTGERSSEFCW